MKAALLRAAPRRLDRVPRHRSAGVLLARFIATLAEWRHRRRSRAQLATFDDRMLRDIGITRIEAESEINKPIWRA